MVLTLFMKRDVHERVRKLVAKKQQHPFGIATKVALAKSEFPQVNISHEGMRNSNFLLKISHSENQDLT
ncbi:hypothetical protein SAMN04487772_1019 [[Clostridium] polysaccharolyticum]|jgi:hypothetical protein|uniref:Uncharacterized protein n=1 Tax=[Clostridium] polysaccharolyticum TaxID=29364 RepID=A0A1H9Y113_9FIRM|nr:hypothetical protein SAMN04487772_1019 [[Clostridium] polysaccharolyticum]